MIKSGHLCEAERRFNLGDKLVQIYSLDRIKRSISGKKLTSTNALSLSRFSLNLPPKNALFLD